MLLFKANTEAFYGLLAKLNCGGDGDSDGGGGPSGADRSASGDPSSGGFGGTAEGRANTESANASRGDAGGSSEPSSLTTFAVNALRSAGLMPTPDPREVVDPSYAPDRASSGDPTSQTGFGSTREGQINTISSGLEKQAMDQNESLARAIFNSQLPSGITQQDLREEVSDRIDPPNIPVLEAAFNLVSPVPYSVLRTTKDFLNNYSGIPPGFHADLPDFSGVEGGENNTAYVNPFVANGAIGQAPIGSDPTQPVIPQGREYSPLLRTIMVGGRTLGQILEEQNGGINS